MRLTKIVASISDIRCDVDFIRKLYNAGMNVARINTAHISPESAATVINNIRKVSNKIAILIDTKGPEIRTTQLEKPLMVSKGDLLCISGDYNCPEENRLLVSYDRFQDILVQGNRILIDDGDIELTVIEKQKCLVCRVENDGIIKNNKSINIPGVSI